MMKIQPDSLRLTALYGLLLSATVIACGAIIGRWIDNTQRLKGENCKTGVINDPLGQPDINNLCENSYNFWP